MVPLGHRQAQCGLEQAVDVAGVEQVRATGHQGHPLRCVVQGHRQMVGGRDLLARQHHVAERQRLGRDLARSAVDPTQRPGARHRRGCVQAQRVGRARPPCVPRVRLQVKFGRCPDRAAPRDRGAPGPRRRSRPGFPCACRSRDRAGRAGPVGRGRARSRPICSDWRRGGSSHARPSQARSSKIAASNSGRQRAVSTSSMRSRKRPPSSRVARQANSAEWAWPRCR